MRKGLASAPAPLEAAAPPQPEDYAEFLRLALPQQTRAVASHRFGSERVWLKKAGPRHGALRYHLLAAITRLMRLDMLAPASAEVRQRLAQAARRVRWLRHLPRGRRWGRDTQRVRAAADLLARWYAR